MQAVDEIEHVSPVLRELGIGEAYSMIIILQLIVGVSRGRRGVFEGNNAHFLRVREIGRWGIELN